jgi:hypothetical protein
MGVCYWAFFKGTHLKFPGLNICFLQKFHNWPLKAKKEHNSEIFWEYLVLFAKTI